MLFLIWSLCWAQLEGFPERGGYPQPTWQAELGFFELPLSTVSRGSGQHGATIYQFRSRAPVQYEPEQHTFVQLNFEHIQNTGNASPAKNVEFDKNMPRQLIHPELGVTYSSFKNLQASYTLGFKFSSPSDAPFKNESVMGYEVFALKRYAVEDKKDSWFWFVQGSNTRTFATHLPLPSVGYEWRPSPTWTVIAGLPFLALSGAIFDKTLFILSYFPVRQVQSQFIYFVWGPVQLFTQYSLREKSYLVYDRGLESDRYKTLQETLSLGLRVPVSQKSMLQLGVGRIFKFEQSFQDRNSKKLAEIHSAEHDFIALSLRSQF